MYPNIESGPVRARRIVRRNNEWTLREHEVVVSHWPRVEEISRRLPHRTVTAIRGFAGKCNLRKPMRQWKQTEDSLLRKRVKQGVSRQEIARELGMTLNQVANRMAYANIHYERKPPQRTGNHLRDEIFQRAFDLNLSRKDLDELCCSGNIFSKWSPSQKVHNRHIWRAVNRLGGKLTVEWDE
jgi:hypothetical protein